ncbi:MAG: translation elongation factor Ts [Pseudomonadota bacterium]
MAQITAAMVKELRDATGAGMMDCKNALTEADGDMEAAIDWLRAKGLSKAAKKASRVAAEGLVGVSVDGSVGAAVEVNSETDFVARNPEFQGLVTTVASLAPAAGGDVDKLNSAEFPGAGKSVADKITELVGTIGENMSLRRAASVSVGNGVVASYVHNQVAPGVGKIGVLVAVETSADKAAAESFGKQVAMHVAAAAPLALTPEEISADIVERERAVFTEQARESGKPDNIIEKMVEGRIRKFYEESVLLSQAFVINPDLSVAKAAEEAGNEAGGDMKITGFVRLQLGEGIEKEADDFAAEVAKAAGGA